MSNYIIREYQTADQTQIIDLFMEFGRYLKKLDESALDLLLVPDGYGQKLFQKMIADVSAKNGKIFVLEVPGKIAGFIAGIILEVGNNEDDFDCKPHRMGRVIELFVSQAYRGRGHGSILIDKLEDFFKNQQCFKINIEVFGPNTSAQKFYAKHGYKSRNIDVVKIV